MSTDAAVAQLTFRDHFVCLDGCVCVGAPSWHCGGTGMPHGGTGDTPSSQGAAGSRGPWWPRWMRTGRPGVTGFRSGWTAEWPSLLQLNCRIRTTEQTWKYFSLIHFQAFDHGRSQDWAGTKVVAGEYTISKRWGPPNRGLLIWRKAASKVPKNRTDYAPAIDSFFQRIITWISN